jgi:hypothetical protein
MSDVITVVKALESLYVANRRYDAPDCPKLRWDYVGKEFYCAYRLTRRDRENYSCAFDENDVGEMKKEGLNCPCWKNRDD